MSDEGFDLCECLWNHDMAMRRLLSILRQTQAYCTDNECLNVSRLPGPRSALPTSDFLMICLVFGLIAFMYALRPRSLRRLGTNNTKIQGNDVNPNDDPPMPPPAAN